MVRDAPDLEPIDAAAAPAASRAGARALAAKIPARRDVTGAERRTGRSCIVTREVRPPSDLLRFVLSPDDLVTPDIRRSLPGRGVWVTAERALVAEASKRKIFARAFRKEVATPADLPDQVALLLRQDALQALSLANKAGAVTSGFEKVRAALCAGKILALIEASDGSAEGRRKLVGTLPSAGELVARPLSIIDCFASAALDLALGRPHVIHAALLKAPAGAFALAKCLRYRRFELTEKQASGRRSVAAPPTRAVVSSRRIEV